MKLLLLMSKKFVDKNFDIDIKTIVKLIIIDVKIIV